MLLSKIFKMGVFKKFDKNNFSFLSQKDNLICISLAILIFFFDRISKIKIIDHQLNNERVYINDFINLDLVWNTGIGFGLLSSNSALIYNSITASKLTEKILFSLILGGALGNFYDRLVYFAVPDFIDIHYQRFHWFTFNIADIFITIGIFLLIIKELILKNEND